MIELRIDTVFNKFYLAINYSYYYRPECWYSFVTAVRKRSLQAQAVSAEMLSSLAHVRSVKEFNQSQRNLLHLLAFL